jgi:hypothetical protein
VAFSSSDLVPVLEPCAEPGLEDVDTDTSTPDSVIVPIAPDPILTAREAVRCIGIDRESRAATAAFAHTVVEVSQRRESYTTVSGKEEQ